MIPQVARKNPTDAPWRWCDRLRYRELWKEGAIITGSEYSTRLSLSRRPKIVRQIRFAFFLLVGSQARRRKEFSSLNERYTWRRQIRPRAGRCSTF